MTIDPLANALNIAPMEIETIQVETPKKELSIIEENNSNMVSALAAEDFTFVRDNYYNILAKGTSALDDVLAVARQSQAPRAYEVFATLMSTIKDINKELLTMHKSAKELQREDLPDNITHNNNTLVLTTAELLKMMKQNKEE
jgi:hypothetical protein